MHSSVVGEEGEEIFVLLVPLLVEPLFVARNERVRSIATNTARFQKLKFPGDKLLVQGAITLRECIQTKSCLWLE